MALPVGGGVVLEGVDAAGVAAGGEASEADIFCEQNYVTSGGGRRMKKESDREEKSKAQNVCKGLIRVKRRERRGGRKGAS